MTFDLWGDDEGRPRGFHGSTALVFDGSEMSGAPITVNRDHDYRERGIRVPDESEMLAECPMSHA